MRLNRDGIAAHCKFHANRLRIRSSALNETQHSRPAISDGFVSAIDHSLRRVDRRRMKLRLVILLALSIAIVIEAIMPAILVPVSDVEGQRDDVDTAG